MSSELEHHGLVLSDYDFHPDEPTVRIFRTPADGVLRLSDTIAVTEAIYNTAVLRHYAFADRWFKINVTTDLNGELIETGDGDGLFALNCDISTPMERDASSIFGVDLFIDVLIRADARSYVVGDEDEFEEMLRGGFLSTAEAKGARQALKDLLALVESGRLLPWLHEEVPFQPCLPPKAPVMDRGLVPRRLLPAIRRTW